jgi:hypothetical protein
MRTATDDAVVSLCRFASRARLVKQVVAGVPVGLADHSGKLTVSVWPEDKLRVRL